jgi:glycosyltransferase involved in cell wall biosynthesis
VPSCAGVITVSPPLADEIRKLYRSPEVTLVRNVPIYRAVEKQDRVRQRLNLDQKTRIALYQGYVLPDRGFDRLIRAARFLEPDIMIVILGPGPDEYFAELRKLIEEEQVTERIRFLPAVPYAELLDWTASADLGLAIFPPEYSLSIRYCLPNKFFEYLMAGLPVLSSQLDVVVELIKAYDVGQVVPSLAPEDIAQTINAMLNDPAALARMSANGKQAILQEFHWGKEQVKLIQLYQKIAPLVYRKKKHSTGEPIKG